MGSVFKAAAAFTAAAWILGVGPFSGPPGAHWDAVRADLAAARPQEALKVQAETLFHSGTPGPEAAR
jgi:hypothetical protein